MDSNKSRVKSSGAGAAKKLKDKKVQIIGFVEGESPNGFPVEEWRPIHPGKLWAYFRHLSGDEFFASAMVNAGEEVLFAINWRNDVTADMVIVYNGDFYDITRIDTYEGYKDDLRIYAKLNADQDIEVVEA